MFALVLVGVSQPDHEAIIDEHFKEVECRLGEEGDMGIFVDCNEEIGY